MGDFNYDELNESDYDLDDSDIDDDDVVANNNVAENQAEPVEVRKKVDNSHICLTDNDYHMFHKDIAKFFNIFNEDYPTFRNKFKTDAQMFEYLKNLTSNMLKASRKLGFNSGSKEIVKKVCVYNSNYYQKCDELFKEFEGDLKEDAGNKLYKILKEEKLRIENERSKSNARKCYEDHTDPYCHLTGDDNIFDALSTLLKKGDKAYRGSSDEYKEIQKQIKQLKNEIKDMGDGLKTSRENKRYVQVCLKAILEKANQYIDSRKNVAFNYAQGSYKGKRVDIMKTVANALEARINYMDEFSMYNENDTDKDFGISYRSRLRKKIDNGTFSATLYTELRACEVINNHNNEDDKLKLIEERSESELKTAEIQALKNGLKGQKITASLTDYYKETVKHYFKNADKYANGHDKVSIIKKVKQIKSFIDHNGEIVNEKNNNVKPEDFDVTEIKKLNIEIAKGQMKILGDSLKRVNNKPEINSMQISGI